MYGKPGTNQYFLLFGVFIDVGCKKIQRSKNGDCKKQPIYTKISVHFGGGSIYLKYCQTILRVSTANLN